MQNFEEAFSSLSTARPGHLSATAPSTAPAAARHAGTRKHNMQDTAVANSRVGSSSGCQATGANSNHIGSSRPTTGTSSSTQCHRAEASSRGHTAVASGSHRTAAATAARGCSHVLQAADLPVAEPTSPLRSSRTALPGWRVGPVDAAGRETAQARSAAQLASMSPVSCCVYSITPNS